MSVSQLRKFIRELRRRGIRIGNLKIFENRMKLQNIVYIAQQFNLNYNYEYSEYLRGPYSSELALDYYKLIKRGVSRPKRKGSVVRWRRW